MRTALRTLPHGEVPTLLLDQARVGALSFTEPTSPR